MESDGAVRERLLQLDGARQEVVRVDGRTQCISGGLADQLADAQLWPVRKFDPSQLASGATCAWSANPVSPAARQWSLR